MGAATAAVVAGTWRFTLVSVAGFAPWIVAGGFFYRNVGEVGLYITCLICFLISALVLLPGLLTGERRVVRTIAWFIPSFVLYAVLWCACWFLLHGRTGEIAGAVVGVGGFVLMSAWTLAPPRPFVATLLIVIAAHAAGYFLGGESMHLLLSAGAAKTAGMLAWGVVYGVGFGAGLGWLIHASRPRPG